MPTITTDVVTATLARSLEFKCAHCGYRGRAQLTVSVEGQATRNATRADSVQVAKARAEKGVGTAFERASLIIPCPKCERLDDENLRRYRRDRLKTLAVLSVPTLLGIVAGLAATDLGAQRMGWLVGVLFALICLQPIAQMFRPPRVDVSFS